MTALTALNKEVPEFLKAAKANALTKALAGGGGGSKRISIRGGVFRMMVNGEEVRKSNSRSMRVIIVNGAPKVARQYFTGVYSADTASAPDCWSNDGIKPDAQAEQPQASRCADCPQNIKGSGASGNRACRFLQRLAVQIVGDPTKDVFQLVLPAQSIFGTGDKDSMPFQQYARMLESNGQSIDAVVTEISFDTDSATPKLVFDAVDYVTEEQYAAAQEAGASEAALRAISYTAAQTDGKKKAVNVLAAPAPAAAPDPAPVAEPKKRASAKPEVPAAKKDLADVMKEWAS
jgi:hypothetical protein